MKNLYINKINNIKNKILIPTIALLLVSITLLGFIGYHTQKQSTYKVLEEMLTAQVNSFEQSIEENIKTSKKAKESINNTLVNIAKSIERQTRFIPEEDMNRSLSEICRELSIDRINIADETGVTKWSSDEDGLAYDFNSDEEARKYLSAITDKTFTTIDENITTAEGKEMHFIGVARQDRPGFIQIGIETSLLDGINTDVDISSIARLTSFGNGGYMIVLNSDGVILSHQDHNLIGKNIKEFDWGEKLLKQSSGKFEFEYLRKNNYISFKKYNSNTIIGATIPSEEYIKGINVFIRNVFITAIVTLILTSIFVNILNNRVIVKRLNKGLKYINEIEKGNLNANFDVVGNDEISLLMKGLHNMNISLRSILSEISEFVEKVGNMSNTLSDSSEQTTVAGQEIAASVAEIASGANEQVREVQEGILKLERLSDAMNEITQDSSTIEEKAIEIQSQNRRNVQAMSVLREKFIDNEKSTQNVTLKTNSLSEKSAQIENIIEVINGIAEQTNLLALNASIEAARAGEAGRGFSVVADEIRKLAEESMSASNKIEVIINSIGEDIRETKLSMQDVSKIVVEANHELHNTVNEFDLLRESNNAIVKLIGNLHEVINKSNKDKDEVMKAMDDVASVSQQTAASTEEISASTEEQASTFEGISYIAQELNQLSEGLVKIVERFNI
ncbi:methyl-accepting chemotaxis protein Mcp [Gottschalkia acidurici 9a]|uniref:Methyl-accepting chemotaxis protein Mcp n=1 Tax=Gottschalkia acidurici (strain ATCC 7906 / DSM 604 / BCRC 14475 / CIP 104303 / KCTC 5404 / NCIMB 10678 / 9a) TaxID=1128398 RepID=K0B2Q5_GOTA9|nr:methyl-accepting chemotaxis protein [Gottschalkia acidurici]AFS79225.1 methyl-accepting chemotaxis protein Mcp [Gottschalkia acidurici 9a]